MYVYYKELQKSMTVKYIALTIVFNRHCQTSRTEMDEVMWFQERDTLFKRGRWRLTILSWFNVYVKSLDFFGRFGLPSQTSNGKITSDVVSLPNFLLVLGYLLLVTLNKDLAPLCVFFQNLIFFNFKIFQLSGNRSKCLIFSFTIYLS